MNRSAGTCVWKTGRDHSGFPCRFPRGWPRRLLHLGGRKLLGLPGRYRFPECGDCGGRGSFNSWWRWNRLRRLLPGILGNLRRFVGGDRLHIGGGLLSGDRRDVVRFGIGGGGCRRRLLWHCFLVVGWRVVDWRIDCRLILWRLIFRDRILRCSRVAFTLRLGKGRGDWRGPRKQAFRRFLHEFIVGPVSPKTYERTVAIEMVD
jgi:hypothetical protein